MNRVEKWLCKTCNDFIDHTEIKEDTNFVNFIIYSGKCTVCKTTNLNAFPKFEPNPIFGIGSIEIK